MSVPKPRYSKEDLDEAHRLPVYPAVWSLLQDGLTPEILQSILEEK